MGATKSNLIAIDSEKLRKILEIKGISLQEVSEKMGFAQEYMKKCLNRGSISKPTITMLEDKFGITHKLYEVSAVPDVQEGQEILPKATIEMIKKAVKEAIKEYKAEAEFLRKWTAENNDKV